MLGTILLVILILALVGALPTWGHSRSWGYLPSGGLGIVVVIVMLIDLLDRVARPRRGAALRNRQFGDGRITAPGRWRWRLRRRATATWRRRRLGWRPTVQSRRRVRNILDRRVIFRGRRRGCDARL